MCFSYLPSPTLPSYPTPLPPIPTSHHNRNPPPFSESSILPETPKNSNPHDSFLPILITGLYILTERKQRKKNKHRKRHPREDEHTHPTTIPPVRHLLVVAFPLVDSCKPFASAVCCILHYSCLTEVGRNILVLSLYPSDSALSTHFLPLTVNPLYYFSAIKWTLPRESSSGALRDWSLLSFLEAEPRRSATAVSVFAPRRTKGTDNHNHTLRLPATKNKNTREACRGIHSYWQSPLRSLGTTGFSDTCLLFCFHRQAANWCVSDSYLVRSFVAARAALTTVLTRLR